MTQDECWDLDTRIANSNATYWTAGDKLTWKSEMKTTKAGKHNSGWCGSFQSECGHYGEDVGIPIDKIAKNHGRTKGAIRSRLKKEGLIEE